MWPLSWQRFVDVNVAAGNRKRVRRVAFDDMELDRVRVAVFDRERHDGTNFIQMLVIG
jgi:hypothetical protein